MLVKFSDSLKSIVGLERPTKPNRQAWYRPIVSPEHGVYVVLLVSALLGIAVAQQWTTATTLALLCAFCGFQAEHPLILQIRQRRSLKSRFLVWGGLYSTIALGLALYLYGQQNQLLSPLLWVYLGAIAAFLVDAISVFYREQKSIWNELITFAAVCSSTLLTYIVTTGSLSKLAIGLWLLCWLFFSSAIFTVKLRKLPSSSTVPGWIYHAIASLIILGLWGNGWLPTLAAIAFGVAVLKFSSVVGWRSWYCSTKIGNVALLETGTAFVFFILSTWAVFQ
jgi:hypothetical protein